MDIVCFSHLRWSFVWQRPQHLLSRFAREMRIIFVEEPVEGDVGVDRIDPAPGVIVLRPRIPSGLDRFESERLQRASLGIEWARLGVRRPVVWFYTPMALPLAIDLRPAATIYDCMDELSAFAGAPQLIPLRERALLDRADLVFTGGRSLYEAKRTRHPRVYCFPSSVDAAHYAAARGWRREPGDQREIPRPRLGFFGVLDERLDGELLDGMAEACPGWSFVLVGPVVKITSEELPARSNIHYLGLKSYAELPAYIAGWDVALIPFARNASTRFISPTKVLEYMAAGKPIVSTSIADIVDPYGRSGLVRVADTVDSAVAAARDALTEDRHLRLSRFDEYLAGTSWDLTYQRMRELILATVTPATLPPAATVRD